MKLSLRELGQLLAIGFSAILLYFAALVGLTLLANALSGGIIYF